MKKTIDGPSSQKLSMDEGMLSTGCVRKTKKLLFSTPALVLYNANAGTTCIVSADASSHQLGAVLLQEQTNGDVKPVSYITKLLL